MTMRLQLQWATNRLFTRRAPGQRFTGRVKAEDKEDGDLTKEVFVEKIVPVKDNKAIVYYGVLDKHQNVGTATKEVEYLTGDAQTGGDVRHCSLQPAVQMFRSEDRLIQWDILHQCQMIRTVRRL